MSELRLNVADVRLRSRVNGPGVRSVVWVQGCTIGCPGCFNPHTHSHEARYLMDPVQLAHRLLEVPDTDGVSISGGEPFEQAAACAVLAATVRGAGRSVTVFIGYTFDQIDHSPLPEIKRFLEQTDLLIAGPYVRDLPCDGTHWRGSTNQTVHALTDRMRKLLEGVTSNSEVVEIKTDGKAILLTGFPSEQDRAWLDRLAVGRVN